MNSGSANDERDPGATTRGSADDDSEPNMGAPSESDAQFPDEPPPEIIAELTVLCVDYVERSLGVAPDLTEETLPIVDHYAIVAREEIERRPEAAPLVARALGAYFGEVLRREFGGFWRIPSDNAHDWQWCSRSVFLTLNPVGVAFDALHGGDRHDGPSSRLRVLPEDRAALDARLAAMPPVEERDFYRLTTRFEVLEVASVLLRARMAESGYDGIEFDEGDYAGEERQF